MNPGLFGKNWRHIFLRAWSVRLMAIAAVLTGLEAAIPIFWETGFLDLPPGWFPTIVFFVVMAAMIARLLVQAGFPND